MILKDLGLTRKRKWETGFYRAGADRGASARGELQGSWEHPAVAEKGGPGLPWAGRTPGKGRVHLAFKRQRPRFHSRSVYF